MPSPADNLVHISAGLTRVVVVSDDFKAWMRNGISADTPAGYYWVRLVSNMRQIEVFENEKALVLWGEDSVLIGNGYKVYNQIISNKFMREALVDNKRLSNGQSHSDVTLVRCSDLCEREFGCRAFFYHPDNKECVLGSTDHASQDHPMTPDTGFLAYSLDPSKKGFYFLCTFKE